MPFCQGVVIPAIANGLSSPRLSSYSRLLGTDDKRNAVGAYLWSLELNAALSPLIGTVEVVLRNSIHNAATNAFGRADWLQDVLKWHGDKVFIRKARSDPAISSAFYRRSCQPYHRQNVVVAGTSRRLKHWRSHVEAKRDNILLALQNEGKPNTPDQIVAHAMFGFWLDLLQAPFEDLNARLSIWPQCQHHIFPHDQTMDRRKAESILIGIKRLRNRVSHHEPAWNVATPLTLIGVQHYMTSRVNEMETLLKSMNPDIVLLMRNAGIFSRLAWLLEPRTISSFAELIPGETINYKRLNRTVRKFTKALATRSGGPLPNPIAPFHVTHRGKTLLALIPFG